MNTFRWCTIILATCLVSVAQEASNAPALRSLTIIRAGVLLDGKSDSPRRNQVIVIRGNRIESVTDAGNSKMPTGATVIDLSNANVLPGLIDSHTHIFLQGEDPAQGLSGCTSPRLARTAPAHRSTIQPHNGCL